MEMIRSLRWTLLLALIALVGGCKAPEMLEFRGVGAVKLERDKEKHQLELHVGLKLFNPNKYALLLKKTRLQVYVNNVMIGEARGRFRRQKMAGGKEGLFELVITTDRDKLLKAAVGSVLNVIIGRKGVKLKVDGYVKGGILMLGKKFPITMEKEIDLDLKGAD